MVIGTSYYGSSNVPMRPTLVVINQSWLCNRPMTVHILAQGKGKTCVVISLLNSTMVGRNYQTGFIVWFKVWGPVIIFNISLIHSMLGSPGTDTCNVFVVVVVVVFFKEKVIPWFNLPQLLAAKRNAFNSFSLTISKNRHFPQSKWMDKGNV